MARDPEVRQARTIADAARTRLVACMSGSREVIDPVEAQRMLDAFRNAQAHAAAAEDRVLVHRGLLTSAEAGQRAARRQVAPRAAGPARPGRGAWAWRLSPREVRRVSVTRVIIGVLALVALGAAGVAIARCCGVRLPLARW